MNYLSELITDIRDFTTLFYVIPPSDCPKDKVSFSPNTVEEQPATSATTVTPFISHKAIEDDQVPEEAEVEEEEEYDTDSVSDYPTADNIWWGRFFRRFDVSSDRYYTNWTNG